MTVVFLLFDQKSSVKEQTMGQVVSQQLSSHTASCTIGHVVPKSFKQLVQQVSLKLQSIHRSALSQKTLFIVVAFAAADYLSSNLNMLQINFLRIILTYMFYCLLCFVALNYVSWPRRHHFWWHELFPPSLGIEPGHGVLQVVL